MDETAVVEETHEERTRAHDDSVWAFGPKFCCATGDDGNIMCASPRRMHAFVFLVFHNAPSSNHTGRSAETAEA